MLAPYIREHRHPCCPCFSLTFPARWHGAGQSSPHTEGGKAKAQPGRGAPVALPGVAGRTTTCRVTTLPSPKCDASTSAPRPLLALACRCGPHPRPVRIAHELRCAYGAAPSNKSLLSRNFPPIISFRSAAELGCSLRSGPSARLSTAPLTSARPAAREHKRLGDGARQRRHTTAQANANVL